MRSPKRRKTTPVSIPLVEAFPASELLFRRAMVAIGVVFRDYCDRRRSEWSKIHNGSIVELDDLWGLVDGKDVHVRNVYWVRKRFLSTLGSALYALPMKVLRSIFHHLELLPKSRSGVVDELVQLFRYGLTREERCAADDIVFTEERKVLEFDHRFTNLWGVTVPSEILRHIFAYLNHTKRGLKTVGSVCSTWYYHYLWTWDVAVVNSMCLGSVPLPVLQNAHTICMRLLNIRFAAVKTFLKRGAAVAKNICLLVSCLSRERIEKRLGWLGQWLKSAEAITLYSPTEEPGIYLDLRHCRSLKTYGVAIDHSSIDARTPLEVYINKNPCWLRHLPAMPSTLHTIGFDMGHDLWVAFRRDPVLPDNVHTIVVTGRHDPSPVCGPIAQRFANMVNHSRVHTLIFQKKGCLWRIFQDAFLQFPGIRHLEVCHYHKHFCEDRCAFRGRIPDEHKKPYAWPYPDGIQFMFPNLESLDVLLYRDLWHPPQDYSGVPEWSGCRARTRVITVDYVRNSSLRRLQKMQRTFL